MLRWILGALLALILIRLILRVARALAFWRGPERPDRSAPPGEPAVGRRGSPVDARSNPGIDRSSVIDVPYTELPHGEDSEAESESDRNAKSGG